MDYKEKDKLRIVNKMRERQSITLILIGIVIAIVLVCYNFFKPHILLNYGMGSFEDIAVIEEIDLTREEITVKVESSDCYSMSSKNPYGKDAVILNCRIMDETTTPLKTLKVSDKIVFTHSFYEPYVVKSIRIYPL